MDEHWDGGGYPDGLKRRTHPARVAASSVSRKCLRSSRTSAAGARALEAVAAAAPTLVRPRSWSTRSRPSRRDRHFWDALLQATDLDSRGRRRAQPSARVQPTTGGSTDRARVCLGHRRQVAVHLRAFGARRRDCAAASATALGWPAAEQRELRRAGADARHRQARRAEPHPRQAGQAHRRRVRKGPKSIHATPSRFCSAHLGSTLWPSMRACTMSASTDAATIAGGPPIV